VESLELQEPLAQEGELTSQESDVSEAAAAAEPEVPRYRFLEDAGSLFDAWRSTGLVEGLELGQSAGERKLFGVQFGAPGERPLSQRTTIYLVGGLDGISVSGSETVLRLVSKLLDQADELPPDMCFVAIPWANPDGLARWLATGCGGGRNDRPIDDDRDGRIDEDGADDVDGDGQVLEMLLEDERGLWVQSADPRILTPARQGQAPRYRRTREGEDEDGDGRYNEDAVGGVVTDHNFPVEWRGPWSGFDAGEWPLSEASSSALVELARPRKSAVFLAFQGNHGWLAAPGGVETDEPFVLESDEEAYRFLLETFRGKTGREQTSLPTQRLARGGERPGTAIDWFYRARGTLAAEVAVWGLGALGSEGAELLDGLQGSEGAWARYFDETRGGMGFVDWQPFELRGGQMALVGGWARNTCFNPEPESLGALGEGLDGMCLALARALPVLDFEILAMPARNRVRQVRARIRNRGLLPSGVGPGGGRFGTTVRVELTAGVELLAGEEVVELGHIPGKGTSPSFSWLFSAPEGTLFTFVVESPWTPPVSFPRRL